MSHLGVADVFHPATGPYNHLLAITGSSEFFDAEVLNIGHIVCKHILITLIITGSENDAFFRIKLYITFFGFRNDSGYSAVFLYELYSGAFKEYFHTCFFGRFSQSFHSVTGIIWFGTKESGDKIDIVPVTFQKVFVWAISLIHDLCSAFQGSVHHPMYSFTRMFGPHFNQFTFRAVIRSCH